MWTPLDLGLLGAPARRYNFLGWIPLRSLTSDVGAEGQKNFENVSGSHGHGGACERGYDWRLELKAEINV